MTHKGLNIQNSPRLPACCVLQILAICLIVQVGNTQPVSITLSADDSQQTSLNTANSRSPITQTVSDLRFAITTFTRDTWHIYTSPARINKRSALWLGGIAVAGGLIYAYDKEIYDAIHRNEEEQPYKPLFKLGEAVEPIGHMGNTNPYYFGILAGSYILGIDKLTLISAQILEAHFVTGLGKNICRHLVGRHRPHEDLGHRSYSRGNGTSFPSGHTINIFELATVLSHHFDYLPFQASCYLSATALGFQRISSDQHWPSDVFVAAIFGYVTTRALLTRHDKSTAVSPETFSGNQTGRVPGSENHGRWLISPAYSARDKFVGLAFHYTF